MYVYMYTYLRTHTHTHIYIYLNAHDEKCIYACKYKYSKSLLRCGFLRPSQLSLNERVII